MGFNSEYSNDLSPIVVDIETAGLPNAADFLEPVTPDARMKDPEKIAADIAAKTAARLEKLALDWNVGRIMAIGWWMEQREDYVVCRDEHTERVALAACWHHCKHRTIVGFNIKGFDLKYMIQRSRYLGVPHPVLDLGKYTRKGVIDLFSELTFNEGTYDHGAMRRTLKAFCRRFGIPVEDAIDGKDIGALVASEDWAAIAAHVRSDVALTVALARKLGVVNVPEAVAV